MAKIETEKSVFFKTCCVRLLAIDLAQNTFHNLEINA